MRIIFGILMICLSLGFTIQAVGQEPGWGTNVQEALKALNLEPDSVDGEDVYEICAACHLPSAWGDSSGVFPQLAGQHSTVLIKQIVDIRARNREHPTMYPFATQIANAQDIADVAAFIEQKPVNPNPFSGPGGESFLLTNSRTEISPRSLFFLQNMLNF